MTMAVGEGNTVIILICNSFLICPSNSWLLESGGLNAERVQISVM